MPSSSVIKGARAHPTRFDPLQLASLLGFFVPAKLFEQAGVELSDARVIALAPHCTEEIIDGDFFWKILPDARRSQLHNLSSSGSIVAAAKHARRCIEAQDSLGRYLIRAVGQQKIGLGRLDSDQLSTILTALQFLKEATDIPVDTNAVEVARGRAEVRRSREVLLRHRLVGRQRQLATLADFVNSAGGSLQQQRNLLVTGIGGSGKSALLAEFARRQQGASWKGSPVIWLDFDRAVLANPTPTSLLIEVSKQIGTHYPELFESLSLFRADIQRYLDEEQLTSASEDQKTNVLWSIWRKHVGQPSAPMANVLLVCDTFEEIMLRGEETVREVTSWINELSDEGIFKNLRTVFSGRALEPLPIITDSTFQTLRVGELGRAAASELLSSMLVEAGRSIECAFSRKLVAKLGGHPLLIKILGNYLIQAGDSGVAELLGSEDEELQRQFSESFLYTRILKRIRTDNPDIQKLAHPGLVLRRVTSDIIRQVLAQPCGLGKITRASSDGLLAALAKQVWLVEPVTDKRVVVHRRDLRQLMLKSMNALDMAAARAVHESAAKWYKNGRDKFMPSSLQAYEHSYHSFFTDNPVYISQDEFENFLNYLGDDRDHIPLKHLAHLKLYAGKALTRAELAELPADAQHWYAERYTARRRETLDYHLTPERLYSQRYMAVEHTFDRHVATRFSEGDLDSLPGLSREGFDNLFERAPHQSRNAGGPADLTSTSIWRIAMAALVTGHTQLVADDALRLARQVIDRGDWERPMRIGRQREMQFGTVISSILALVDPSARISDQAVELPRLVSSTQELRTIQLLAFDRPGSENTGEVLVKLGLFRYLQEEFLHTVGSGRTSRFFSNKNVENFLAEIKRFQHAESRTSIANLQELQASFPPLGFDLRRISRMRSPIFNHAIVPELYPMIRRAISRQDAGFLFSFVESMSLRFATWPRELMIDSFVGLYGISRHRAHSTLLDVADRHGVLKELAFHVQVRRNDRPRVLALVEHYEDRLNK